MDNNKKVKANNNSKPKANKVNYTPYRKAYNQAKGMLVQLHQKEFKEILESRLNPQTA